ncbi:VOC family protein [Halomonas sp. HP20-15]|uniref:VOC family protein n=1 Tax=Halomonas sp. HP20-15 TaxID=3085901 RepID=UPI002981DC36|nr:VOC family protein [Halomonas sp. HP20-15]MDW5377144.1 VOC family protein [Halomonas sp. HP20-15]
MHKSRLACLVVDGQNDVNEAAYFWSQALGYEIAETDGRYTRLDTPADQPQILIQQVSHPSRVHLDIESDDIEAEVARMQALGASVVERLARWVVMQAPTGHRFCIVGPQRSDFASAPAVNVWR